MNLHLIISCIGGLFFGVSLLKFAFRQEALAILYMIAAIILLDVYFSIPKKFDRKYQTFEITDK